MKIEYLLFNLVVLLLPTISSFLLRQPVVFYLRSMIRTVLLVAVPFVLLDGLVAGNFWQFNPRYILGAWVFSLPIEEILFFVTVPIATLFLWEFHRQKLGRASNRERPQILYVLIVILIGLGLLFLLNGLFYSALACLMLAGVLIYDAKKATGVFSYSNRIYFLMIIILTIAFNNYLTGRPIVLYNEAYLSGVRILTMPIEDLLFSLSLIGANILAYQRFYPKVKANNSV
jgi:lycopene cyclase domain-containing protein